MSLERIEITPFAVIVGEILQERRTGNLTVIRAPLRKVLYWSQGELVLITSSAPEDSLSDFLVRRGVVAAERAAQMMTDDPTDAVARFHEAGLAELSWRQTLLREWLTAQFVPLFSLDEGTAAFTDDAAIAPEKRVGFERVLHGSVEPEIALLEEVAAAECVFHRADAGVRKRSVVAAYVDEVVRHSAEASHHLIGYICQSRVA